MCDPSWFPIFHSCFCMCSRGLGLYHGPDRRAGFVSSGRWAFQKLVLRLRRRTKGGWWRVAATTMTTGVHAVLISPRPPSWSAPIATPSSLGGPDLDFATLLDDPSLRAGAPRWLAQTTCPFLSLLMI